MVYSKGNDDYLFLRVSVDIVLGRCLVYGSRKNGTSEMTSRLLYM